MPIGPPAVAVGSHWGFRYIGRASPASALWRHPKRRRIKAHVTDQAPAPNPSGEPRPAVPASVRVLGTVLIVIVLLAFVEAASYVAVSFFIAPRDRGAFYRPPVLDRDAYESYLASRDPTLGWPSPSAFGGPTFDESGARRSPVFPQPGGECVVLVGDSFTFADEVEHDVAWGNVLAGRLGCRVGNFGVGGYGTDQALMRFEQLATMPARFAVLGFYPHNAQRNVNQNRYFLGGGTRIRLKPRFVLEGEQLRPVAIQRFGFDQYVESMEQPRAHYPHEAYLPGSSIGPIPLGFPYAAVAARYLLSERVMNYLQGRPGWIGLFDPDHPSGALTITVGIAEAFGRLARERGMHPLVVTFATPASMELFASTGEIAIAPLLDALESRGIDVLDLHRPFADRLGEESYCEVLTKPELCRGHFNALGNQWLAEIVHARLDALEER
jgi:hypothetical protein